MCHFTTTGIIKPTKLLKQTRKENEFIRVKIVILLDFCNKKVIFIFFYVKDVKKLVRNTSN